MEGLQWNNRWLIGCRLNAQAHSGICAAHQYIGIYVTQNNKNNKLVCCISDAAMQAISNKSLDWVQLQDLRA